MMQPSIASGLMRAVAGGNAAEVAEMRVLRDEIARRDDRIEELEGLLGLRVQVLPKVRMTPTGRKIFGILLNAPGWTSSETLTNAIWGSLPECDWPSDPYICLKVHVHRLRNSLAPFKIELDTIFAAAGRGGYFMPPEMKAIARALIVREP